MADVVGFKFPFQEGSEGFPASTTSLDQALMDSIFVICSTVKGELEMEPDFGLIAIEKVFDANNDTTALAIRFDLENTLRKYERRARIRDVTFETDPEDPTLLILTVKYLNVETQEINQVEIEFPQSPV